MNTSLKELFDRLEGQRLALLKGIKHLGPDQLQMHPPGKWSLSQVFAHLIASEQLSVQYLRKKIQAIDEQPNTGLIEELKMWALIISQRLPFKFKAPKVVVDHTPAFKDVAEIESAWNQTRKELKDVLGRFGANHLTRKIYKHPVAGKLNIVQATRFFSEHIIHHQPQIKRLLKQN
ncbi:MAG: DinB family protein [Cyclobacteriaceae bacterium]|nr:MAG: DinB family protein [Cyclobacteriaceae bacterium]